MEDAGGFGEVEESGTLSFINMTKRARIVVQCMGSKAIMTEMRNRACITFLYTLMKKRLCVCIN